MTYSASIEWHCDHAGTLRVHPCDGGALGDPYVWCCTLVRYRDVAEIKGVCTPLPSSAAARAVVRALRAVGIAERRYDRPGRLVIKGNA